jgi:hypothetical protein
MTNWYTKWIVDTLNLEERVAVILRILDIAECFSEMNNFSGLKEIFSGLEMAAVTRLKTTLEVSRVEQHKMYIYLRELFGDHEIGMARKSAQLNCP